jgi:hypothetical protein
VELRLIYLTVLASPIGKQKPSNSRARVYVIGAFLISANPFKSESWKQNDPEKVSLERICKNTEHGEGRKAKGFELTRAEKGNVTVNCSARDSGTRFLAAKDVRQSAVAQVAPKTTMRTVTMRVPDGWRGLVDSWSLRVMLEDFFRNHTLSELATDPQPGHARLSLSLPQFRTGGISESVFLRRLIASYLPALKSFRSGKCAVSSIGSHRPIPKLQARVDEPEGLSASCEPPWESHQRPDELEGYDTAVDEWKRRLAAASIKPTDFAPQRPVPSLRAEVFRDVVLNLIFALLVVALLFFCFSNCESGTKVTGAYTT